MLKWPAFEAWKCSRLNPNGKCGFIVVRRGVATGSEKDTTTSDKSRGQAQTQNPLTGKDLTGKDLFGEN